jgi:predicted dehydrogenase
MLTLGLRSGATVSATIGTNAPNGSGHRIEVYGDDGMLVLANPGPDYMRGFSLTTRRRGEAEPTVLYADDTSAQGDGRIPPVVGLVSAFVGAIRTGLPAWPGIEQGRRVQVLLDAARQAAAQARVVEVAEP